MEKQHTPDWINNAAEDIYVHAANDHDGFVRDATEIIAKHAPKGQQEATWQPIDTAPKDRFIDLWVDGDRVTGGWHSLVRGFATVKQKGRQVEIMRIDGNITHWMPIPPPPEETK